MVWVIWGLIALLLYSLALGGCQYRRGWKEATESLKTDTVEVEKVKWDTTFVDKPVPVNQYIVKHKTDTFEIHDTLPNGNAVVEIPITQAKYHKDSLYTAWVSGYKPNLDSIKVFSKTVTNTTTITRNLLKKPKITLSAGVGYYYTLQSKKFEPAVGVTIGIPILNKY
jgi:hypothetical protein